MIWPLLSWFYRFFGNSRELFTELKNENMVLTFQCYCAVVKRTSKWKIKWSACGEYCLYYGDLLHHIGAVRGYILVWTDLFSLLTRKTTSEKSSCCRVHSWYTENRIKKLLLLFIFRFSNELNPKSHRNVDLCSWREVDLQLSWIIGASCSQWMIWKWSDNFLWNSLVKQ